MDNNWLIQPHKKDIILEITVDGEPISASRPRLGKHGNTYIPARARQYRELLMWHILALRPKSIGKETVGIQILFYRSNQQRIDIDNLVKSVFDAITGVKLWNDDNQVRELVARLWLGDSKPRASFMVYRVQNPSPANHCLTCGKELSRLKPGADHKYCSAQCRQVAKRINLICPQCDKEFSISKCLFIRNGDKYPLRCCSRACSIQYHQNLRRIKGNESDKWRCQVCGGRVSRKEYRQCRGCSMKTRSDPTTNYWKLRHARVLAKSLTNQF